MLYFLKFIDDPEFKGIFFRNTTKQIDRAVWPTVLKLYDPFLRYHSGENKGKLKGKARIKTKDKTIVFPSGATIEFTYIGSDAEIQENMIGAEITLAAIDEFGKVSETAFNYIRTRLRSPSKYESCMRISMNPEPNHHSLKFLNRYIGEDGYAIPEYSGRMAYFVHVDGEVVTSWDKEELKDKYPHLEPRAYTFIPSSIDDNPAMLKANPNYKDELSANGRANAEILLKGNWRYKPEASGIFSQTLIKEVERKDVPEHLTLVRAWDKASKKPVKEGGDAKTINPDYTASIKMGRCSDGNIYVFGDYCRERDGKQRMRFRENPGERDKLILAQAEKDGDNVTVVFPRDPAQAGIFEYQESAKKMQQEGFSVIPDPTPSNRGKSMRFEPFVSACYSGNVYWVKESFDPACWDYLMMELENFNGDKNGGYKDDLVDTFGTAFSAIIKKQVIHTPPALKTSVSNKSKISVLRQNPMFNRKNLR